MFEAGLLIRAESVTEIERDRTQVVGLGFEIDLRVDGELRLRLPHICANLIPRDVDQVVRIRIRGPARGVFGLQIKREPGLAGVDRLLVGKDQAFLATVDVEFRDKNPRLSVKCIVEFPTTPAIELREEHT